ncbi:MAG: peptidoglycan-binding protein [Ruminococcus sp.]|nr:peptidoglycan-binding protein [Ruminococcus sp.]
MKKRIFAIFLCALLALTAMVSLGGCSPKDDNYPVTVGQTKITDKPEKVAVLSDNLADIIYYMGYSTQICAISDACTQEELTKYIESVGSETAPDIDGLVRCGAKYVLTDTPLSETVMGKLSDHGIKVLCFMTPTTAEQLATLYSTIGSIFAGKPDGQNTAKDAYTRLISTIEQAEKEVEGSTVVKLVCYLYLDEDNNLCSFNSTTCEGMILDYVSATNVATNFLEEKVDENILRLSNPDYVFYDNEETLNYLKDNQTLASMNAIKNNNTYILPRTALQRLGGSMIATQSFMISKMFPASISENTTGESYAEKYGITITDTTSYKAGDDNEDIKAIQQRLMDLGYLVLEGGDEATTYFGGKTESALQSFQTANGIEATGIADKDTLSVLFLSTTLSVSGQTVAPDGASETPTEPEETQPSTGAEEPATSAQSSGSTNGYGIDLSSSKAYSAGDEHPDIAVIQQRLEELLYISFSDGDTYTNYFGPGTENAITRFQESNGLSATGQADYETLKVLFSAEAKQPN